MPRKSCEPRQRRFAKLAIVLLVFISVEAISHLSNMLSLVSETKEGRETVTSTSFLVSEIDWDEEKLLEEDLLKDDLGGGGEAPDGSSYLVGLARQFANCVSKSREICWIILFMSIFVETLSTTVAKYASDFASPALLGLSCSLVILSQCGLTASLAQIDVGIAYAVWAAVGTATVTIFSFLLFDEELDVVKTACLLMIVTGVVGLHLREEHD